MGKVSQIKQAEKGNKCGYGAYVDVWKKHNIGIINIGNFYINRINKIKWWNKQLNKYEYFNVLITPLGYSVVDFETHSPEYLDQVEFIFVRRFDNTY